MGYKLIAIGYWHRKDVALYSYKKLSFQFKLKGTEEVAQILSKSGRTLQRLLHSDRPCPIALLKPSNQKGVERKTRDHNFQYFSVPFIVSVIQEEDIVIIIINELCGCKKPHLLS